MVHFFLIFAFIIIWESDSLLLSRYLYFLGISLIGFAMVLLGYMADIWALFFNFIAGLLLIWLR